MIRLDKYLANLGLVSRRSAEKTVRAGLVLVNGEEVKKSDTKISFGDIITFEGNDVEVRENISIILHKPASYISSDQDEYGYKSYRDLLQDCPYVNLLHVAGRLDQDTEGVLVLSNSGQFIHQVISPKWEKEKEYEVHLEKEISDKVIGELEKGVILDDGYHTLPAKIKKLDNKKILLTITEGKYHQVKRMLESVKNKVIYLKRLRVGDWTLDGLEKGEWKYVGE